MGTEGAEMGAEMGADMERDIKKKVRGNRGRDRAAEGMAAEGTAAGAGIRDGSEGTGSGAGGARGEAVGEGYTFEGAFARLEEIVQQLESGDAPLQDALALFEEGVRMARLCSERLDEAETRIRVLMEDEAGSLEEVPWDGAGHGRPEGWDGID